LDVVLLIVSALSVLSESNLKGITIIDQQLPFIQAAGVLNSFSFNSRDVSILWLFAHSLHSSQVKGYGSKALACSGKVKINTILIHCALRLIYVAC